MPWTTPKTWAPSEVLTSSDLNLYVRDNLAALKAPVTTHLESASAFTTTSSSFVDIDPAFNASLVTTGGPLLIIAGFMINGTYPNGEIHIALNGVPLTLPTASGVSNWRSLYGWTVPLAAGTHVVKPRYRQTGGTFGLTYTYFHVREAS